MCPRQGSNFSLLRQRKVTKRKATPFAGRPRGDCSALLGHCSRAQLASFALLTALRQGARSQMWRRAAHAAAKPCAARRLAGAPRSREPPASRASHQKPHRLMRTPKRQRGVCRCSLFGPRGWRRGAQGFGAGAQRLRGLTSRGCLSAVSKANVASSARRPKDRAPQSSPAQPDRHRRVAFLCLLSLAKQRK